jgi:hypothetical protein
MVLFASLGELIGPPLTNAGFRSQRRKLFLKAENRRIRQREEGQAWRDNHSFSLIMLAGIPKKSGESVKRKAGFPEPNRRVRSVNAS